MILSASHLSKSFPSASGPVPILSDVSLGIDAGETVALTGESGSGKSTLLHILGALDQADSGEVEINSQPLSGLDDRGRAALRRNAIGIVFQQFNLIPSLTIADNLAFQARLAGREDKAWLQVLTERLGLAAHLRKYPEELSGGQQQRVAIGRAMAARPGLILADEPTGNLDEATSDSVIGLLLELIAETRAGFLMVTHSERLAERMARRVHLRAGQLA